MRIPRKIVALTAAVAIAIMVSGMVGGWWGCNRPGGSYVGYANIPGVGEFLWSTTVTMDTANRMFIESEFGACPPDLGGMLPASDSRTPMVGEAIRTGKRTWKYTQIGYGYKTLTDPITMIVRTFIIHDTGTMTFSKNYDEVEIDDHMAFFVLPSDDDGLEADGFPDHDAEPIVIPGTLFMKRVEVVPPYPAPPAP